MLGYGMQCNLPANNVIAAGIIFGDLVAATLFRLDRWDGLLRAAYIRGDELTILSVVCDNVRL